MSSERSGSNLLRTLLSNHSNIAAPVAPQFLSCFHTLILYYGLLSEEANAFRLMEDMLAVANHPYYAWDLSVDQDDVYRRYQPKVFLDFFNLLYEERSTAEGKKRFVCKENRIFDFASHLQKYYVEPKFIYLYRDPRDFAASFKKVHFGPKTPYSAARLWRQEQDKCEVLISTFRLPVHRVKYENLISDPPTVMGDVLAFLDEPVEESCFQVQAGRNQDQTWNVAWKNLGRPILRANRGKYRKEFDTKAVNIIETVAKESMVHLGYDFDTQADWTTPRFFRYRNAVSGRYRRLRVKMENTETSQVLASRNALINAISRKRKEEWLNRWGQSRQGH
jgi:hypothetical protein